MAICRRLILLVCLLASACAAAETPVAFSTLGGDAWTFNKLVEGSVPPGSCDALEVVSPRSTVATRPYGGSFVARLGLVEGDNAIRATCLHAGSVRGTTTQTWTVRLHDRPKARARVAGEDGLVQLDAGTSEVAPARAEPIISFAWRKVGGDQAHLPGLPAQGEQVSIPVPADGDYILEVQVTDASGRSDRSRVAFAIRGGAVEPKDVMRQPPSWMARAVIYGVAPKLFSGGDLAGVAARLDDLAALGINTIWLSPITASPPGDYGYAVTDYFTVRPEFGGAGSLRDFVRAAHAREIRVLLDIVPNHLSERHPYFESRAEHGRASPYFSFFAHTPEGEAIHYFDWENLKNLNYRNPEVRNLVLEAFAFWVREFDIDGFRVDVAWGPRDRAPEFWPQLRRELKRIKPDLLLIAEASARDRYYVAAAFDAAYDWTEKLGEWAWQQAFADPARTAAHLRTALAASPGAEIVRFINNNDTGRRFVDRYGVPRTRVASAMLITLPGIPALFAGDEVGASFEPYGSTQAIDWRDRFGLREWYRKLVALRQAQPALTSSGFRLLEIPARDQVLAYLRGNTPGERILVMLNYGPEAQTVALPADVAAAMGGGEGLVDLLAGDRLGPGRIRVAGHGVRILKAARR